MAPKPPVVLAYYADWAADKLPVARIDWRPLTHVTHSFAVVRADGSLALPDKSRSRELCARAKDAGKKALLALGGASSNRALSDATATPDGVAKLADALVKVVKGAGYSGLDVDWEAPEDPQDQDHMNALVRALRERLPAGALITMAVPSTDWAGRWYDRDVLAPLVDLLCVMAYDMHGPWGSHAGHNAPLAAPPEDPDGAILNVPASLDYWLTRRGWPAGKVLLGIPLYGRGFRAAKWGDPAKGDHDRSYVPLSGIPVLTRAGWKEDRDPAARVPYLVSPDGAELLSFEDERSAREKGALARSRGAGGIFFWELTQDKPGLPTLRAARDGYIRGR
jgi:chitinase